MPLPQIINWRGTLFQRQLQDALDYLDDNLGGSLADLGVTATAAELNILDGATLTTAELNQLDGVTLGTFAAEDTADYIQAQAVWDAGTDTTESTITAAKLAGAIAALAGGSSFELITRTVISGNPATIDFTFDETLYDSIIFKLQNVIPQTDSRELRLQTSADGGSSYDAGASAYHYNYQYQDDATGSADVASTGAAFIELGRQLGSAGSEAGWSGNVELFGPNLAKRTGISYTGGYWVPTGDLERVTGFGSRVSNGIVNGVRFLLSGTGGFENGGVIAMFGVRNS